MAGVLGLAALYAREKTGKGQFIDVSITDGMVFMNWLHGGSRPSIRVIAGLLLGFAGVALLVGGLENLGQNNIGLVGGTVVVVGAFLWANGSLYSRSAKLPSSPLLATSMEMISPDDSSAALRGR
jgi:drug/metabolite transporter (DMT)-like permease